MALMQAADSAIPDCSWTPSSPWTAGGAGEWQRWTAARVSRRCCQGLTRVMTSEGSTAHRPRGASHSRWFSLKACALFPVTPFLESAHPADFLADSLGWKGIACPESPRKLLFLAGASRTGRVRLGFHIYVCLLSYFLKCSLRCLG